MKNIFEASNSLEAHMISNLLEQEGIKSNIEGEYLQGGVGELQTQGLVRVTVEDSNYDAARSLVKEWESKQPSIESSNSTKIKSSRSGSGFIILLVGVAAMYWVYNSPVNKNGIDYDRDGVNDEVWIYKDNRITRLEVDRNLDGNVDLIYNYNIKGLASSSQLDEDFDGVFETTVIMKKGNAHTQESDTNQDGVVDIKSYFEFGVLNKVVIYGEVPGTPVKVQNFHLGKLVSSEFDSDRNGTLDVVYEYDRFGEIATKSVTTQPYNLK